MARASDLKVAILAGGLATRLGAAATRVPKLLVDVAGEPFFTHQLRLLRAAGLRRIVLCLGHLGAQIVDRYGDGTADGVEIEYVFDGPRLLGTGGALIQALPRLGEAFYVLYGDSYLPIDYQAPGIRLLESERAALMTVFRNAGAYDASNVWFENGQIHVYRKTNRIPQMHHIDYGLGVFRARAFEGWPRDSVVDLAAIQSSLAEQGQLIGYEVHDRFFEIGSPAGLAELSARLMRPPSSTAST